MYNTETLYVTDLDGTLLNDKSVISGTSRKLLNELCEAGALISYATARTPATVTEIFRGINMNIPGIVMTGAAMYDMNSHEYLFPKFLRNEDVKKALSVFDNYNIYPFVYIWRSDNKLHAFHPEQMNEGEREFYEIRRDMGLKKFHLYDSPMNDDFDHVFLIFCVNERDLLIPIVDKLEEVIDYKVSYYNDIFRPGSGFLEVFAPGVDKASSIIKLKELTGAKRTVVFGDNLNDISMFKVSDVSIAVSNAYEEVKDMANIIIGPNTEDSVVKYIYQDFFGKC